MRPLSRRDFLKYSTMGLSALAFNPLLDNRSLLKGFELGRVATDQLSVYSKPDDTSLIKYQVFRDDLVNIYEDVISENGPGYNPLWYRIWGGYIHSARVFKVKEILNEPLCEVPKSGLLAEVTVPYTRSYHYTRSTGYYPIYRLYYGSLHWITGIEDGPDGQPYYRIHDELLGDGKAGAFNYFAPAVHFRYVQPDEYSPLSQDVSPGQKKIEVDLSTQTLVAYEGSKQVFKTVISSGVPSSRNTDTPRGDFHIMRKIPSKNMSRDTTFTDDIYAGVLTGVPWASFITDPVAFHGVYWHNNFGMTMSSGCINMRTEEAKWLFRWTTPVTPANTREVNELHNDGTRVTIY